MPRQFNSFTDARAGLRNVLDAAAAGLVTTVRRGGERQHRSLVELVELSDDDQLRSWLLGTAEVSDASVRRAVRRQRYRSVGDPQPTGAAESVQT